MVWYSGGKTHRGRRDRHKRQNDHDVSYQTALGAHEGAKVGLIGTNQNLISDKTIPTDRTTPDALTVQRLLAQMVDAGCTYAVMEVSSHALMQSRGRRNPIPRRCFHEPDAGSS